MTMFAGMDVLALQLPVDRRYVVEDLPRFID